MRLIEYATAYIALMVLAKKDFPFSISYELVKLKRRILPKVEYYTEQEHALIKRYAQLDENGNPIIHDGQFTCHGDTVEEQIANTQEYERLHRELDMVEDHEVIERIMLKLPGSLEVRPETLEALAPFIEFEVAQ